MNRIMGYDEYYGVGECSSEQEEGDLVNHPRHYMSESGLEVIDVIESFGLDRDHYLACAIKYILRAGKKDDFKQDVKKAIWYLERRVHTIKPCKGSHGACR